MLYNRPALCLMPLAYASVVAPRRLASDTLLVIRNTREATDFILVTQCRNRGITASRSNKKGFLPACSLTRGIEKERKKKVLLTKY